MDIGALILTCDKNADLAPFVNASYDRLFPGLGEALIVTETNGSPYGDRNVLCAESEDFATKMRLGLQALHSEHVLVLLDDHYLLGDDAVERIRLGGEDLVANEAVCISLAKSEKAFVKYRPGVTSSAGVFADLQKYQIDFHPTLWKKDALFAVLGNQPMTAWEIEPLFVKFILEHDLKALYSNKPLHFVELVYRGTFIRKPFLKHGSSIYAGNRPVQSRWVYMKFRFRMWVYHRVPYRVKKAISKK